MLIGEMELALAEYDRGDREESYLKERSAELLDLPNPALMPAALRRDRTSNRVAS